MRRSNDETSPEVLASEWRHLRLALAERMERLVERRSQSVDATEIAALQKQIDEVREQVRTLTLEETVAQFVEDAERYVVAANTVADDLGLGRDPDSEVA